MSENKLVEIISPGIDCLEKKFEVQCPICFCKFKFCLNAVGVTRYGNRDAEFYVYCPFSTCLQKCNVENTVAKFHTFLKKREIYTAESDF